ncbi:MAG: glycosyltransferase [Pyrinomonadaceae bacterium]
MAASAFPEEMKKVKLYSEEDTSLERETKESEDDPPEISVFLPVFNENHLRPLHVKLGEELVILGRTAEIIYVDDGSSDGSLTVLREIAAHDPRCASSPSDEITARRRQWPPVLMRRGDRLVLMDADLQNDPADIKRLLDKLEEGYDVVSGWRGNARTNVDAQNSIGDCQPSNFIYRRRASTITAAH